MATSTVQSGRSFSFATVTHSSTILWQVSLYVSQFWLCRISQSPRVLWNEQYQDPKRVFAPEARSAHGADKRAFRAIYMFSIIYAYFVQFLDGQGHPHQFLREGPYMAQHKSASLCNLRRAKDRTGEPSTTKADNDPRTPNRKSCAKLHGQLPPRDKMRNHGYLSGRLSQIKSFIWRPTSSTVLSEKVRVFFISFSIGVPSQFFDAQEIFGWWTQIADYRLNVTDLPFLLY